MTSPEPPAPHPYDSSASPHPHLAPPPPARPRRGLPWWAITLIVVGSVGVLAGPVTLAAVVVSRIAPVIHTLVDPPNRSGDDGSADGQGDADPDVDPADMLHGRWELGRTVPTTLLPLWSVSAPDGWESVHHDDASGITEFSEPVTRCEFVAYQGESTLPGTSATDAAATAALTHELAKTFAAKFAAGEGIEGVSSRDLDPQWLWADDDADVQFSVMQTDYTRDGAKWTAFTYARAFLDSHSVLYENVECPTSVLDSSGGIVFYTAAAAGIITY